MTLKEKNVKFHFILPVEMSLIIAQGYCLRGCLISPVFFFFTSSNVTTRKKLLYSYWATLLTYLFKKFTVSVCVYVCSHDGCKWDAIPHRRRGGQGTTLQSFSFLLPLCGFQDQTQAIKLVQQALLAHEPSSQLALQFLIVPKQFKDPHFVFNSCRHLQPSQACLCHLPCYCI